MRILFTTALTATLGLGLLACGDDDETETPIPQVAGPTTFRVELSNNGSAFAFPMSGVFNTPTGATDPGAIGPGDSYSFSFMASPGMRLSFATMFIPSNDWIYSPLGTGIALFDDQGMPITGDVTSEIRLIDVGTEADQTLGEGTNQPQRNPEGHEDDPNTMVRMVTAGEGGVPATSEVISVQLSVTQDNGAFQFTATLTNMSNDTTLGGTQAVPLSPGAFVVHTDDGPLFTMGEADLGMGLQEIAEIGDPSVLGPAVEAMTGVTLLGSPGVYGVSSQTGLLFEIGMPDRGQGLEAIAEDGSPSTLGDALSQAVAVSGVFNTADGAADPGPIGPGASYTFEVTASEGDRLFLAGMVVPSNDWLFATSDQGILLFDGGAPVSGDFTSALAAYDAGTEVDQPLGFGQDQVQNQGGATNVGAADPDDTVRALGISHPYGLTITAVP